MIAAQSTRPAMTRGADRGARELKAPRCRVQGRVGRPRAAHETIVELNEVLGAEVHPQIHPTARR
jgi:hypothetical protein